MNSAPNSSVPIKIQVKPKRTWPKRLLLSMIVLLLLINAGAVYFIYYKAKVMAESASSAVKNPSIFSGAGLGSALPGSDVAGQDITGVGRYQGSVRTSYSVSGGVTTVEYQTKDSPTAVLTYFKTQLASNGWILEKASNTDIKFSYGASIITISTSQDSTTKITTYKIVL
jgi:hypothetical protein